MPENAAASPSPDSLPATLNPANLPLNLPLFGSRLIEASAGTGKTWTIAALYVRLVLGHGPGSIQGLAPERILVMTFTRAATSELTSRIRERLAQAAAYFRQPPQAQEAQRDAFLEALLQDYGSDAARRMAAWQLESAARSMDEAAIHTIDGWCQSVLREFAALTGSLGEQTLAPSTEHLRATAALDYWRQQIYPLQGQTLDAALAQWSSLATWQKKAAQLKLAPPPDGATTHAIAAPLQLSQPDMPAALGQPQDLARTPLAQLLPALLKAQAQRLQTLGEQWRAQVQDLQDWVNAQTDKAGPHGKHWQATKFSPANLNKWVEKIRVWAQNPSLKLELTEPASKRLSPEGLQEARKPDAPPLEVPPVIHDLQALLRELPALAAHTGTWLTLHAQWHVAQRFEALKQAAGVFDFADSLSRVERALQGPHGATLRQRLLERYPVALVDEFQDTSAQQYRVFELIYEPAHNHADSALLVIGDPKQSIYRFRGADIRSYLRVRQATQGRHYSLQKNFRSSKALVHAVNHLFEPAENRPGPGAFRYRPSTASTAANPVPFTSVDANGRSQFWGRAGQPLPALTIAATYESLGQTASNQRYAQWCAEQIVQWLGDPQVGFYSGKSEGEDEGKGDADGGGSGQFQRLRPTDIAVLVASRKEAMLVQQALRQRKLSSVYLSDRESVFNSAEAQDLALWLQAVATPQDVALARAAFASKLLDYPQPALEHMADSEAALENLLHTLQKLQKTWRQLGVLPMLRQSLHSFAMPRRWLQNPSAATGERKLTNYLHLAELLQQAARTVEGEQALIAWLQLQINAAAQGQQADGDAAIVRLESDADLIQIVTIHKSKGLEYPVVLLPFACNHKPVKKTGSAAAAPTEDEPDNADDAPDNDEERLQENLRLFYVAVTRARHCLWLGFASIRHGNAKSCSTHRSAWGYLLAGDAPAPLDASQWRDALAAWQQSLPQLPGPPAGAIIALQETPFAHATSNASNAGNAPSANSASGTKRADSAIPVTPYQSHETPTALAPERHFTGQPDTRWRISSFSSLARNNAQGTQDLQGTPGEVPAMAMEITSAIGNAPEPPIPPAASHMLLWQPAPKGASDEGPLPASSSSAEPAPRAAAWHNLPGGPRMGNFVHDQLEWLGQNGFAPSLSEADQRRIRQNAQYAGWDAHADALCNWLQACLQTPLWPLQDCPGKDGQHSTGASTGSPTLAAFNASLAEMEFWLPTARLDSAALDRFTRQWLWPHLPRPTLGPHHTHGMLMGFADLVFEYQGRYWVLDYKTNHLGNGPAHYHASALQQAVLHHRYDLQAMLYLLALHRLLRARLGAAYQPQQHLGGAVYWFLRGQDHEDHGLVHMPANPAILQDADAWMRHPAPAAHNAHTPA